jgi:hypothetical protein
MGEMAPEDAAGAALRRRAELGAAPPENLAAFAHFAADIR